MATSIKTRQRIAFVRPGAPVGNTLVLAGDLVVHTRTLLGVLRVFFSRLAAADRQAIVFGLRASAASFEDCHRALLEHEAQLDEAEDELNARRVAGPRQKGRK